MTTLRSTRRVTAISLAAITMAVGCSSDGDDPTGDDVNGDNLVEQLDDLGGQTVETTTITHELGSPTVNIGGLDVDLPHASDLDFAEGRNIRVAPTWPTLDDKDFRHPDVLEGVPEYGLATFAQIELVTDDESRQLLIDQSFASVGKEDYAVEHTSTVTDTTGVTCWSEIRLQQRGQVLDGWGVTMIAGPEIASSAIVTSIPAYGEEIPAIVGSVVEAACGTRPDGL